MTGVVHIQNLNHTHKLLENYAFSDNTTTFDIRNIIYGTYTVQKFLIFINYYYKIHNCMQLQQYTFIFEQFISFISGNDTLFIQHIHVTCDVQHCYEQTNVDN